MPHVVFAGGGSGGHIYPALAIAQCLREIDPTSTCSWIVSRRPIDARIMQTARESFAGVPAEPARLRPDGMIRFLRGWGPSVRQTRRMLRDARTRGADGSLVLIAMGGFVAAPAVQGARVERVPCVLVNLDAVPGRANRWIGRRAQIRITAFDSDSVPRDWERVRPIVRPSISTGRTPQVSRESFGLDPDRPTLLVTGGSQGASSIDQLLLEICQAHAELLAGWQVIHQCGARPGALEDAYRAAGVPARVLPFIESMGDAWSGASLAVSRAGAGAVGEAWAGGTPTVFLPYPHHRDDHQTRNAEPLARAGGAVVLLDRNDAARTLEAGFETIRELLQDGSKREAMTRRLVSLGPADGAEAVARRVLALSRE